MSPGPRATPDGNGRDHGPHTLKVWRGAVVGVYGDDVFVELAPRMQGVISVRQFALRPKIGDEFEFTLRGREDGLWALSRRDTASLATWEDMEPGSLVHARAVRAIPGGLEMKIGPLHAFLPRSHSGLQRDEPLDLLVGKTLVCEVIEVDRERQRVLVSRKLVQQRERVDERQREVGSLAPGQIVHGHVTRLEPYGAFVAFGKGIEGLIHVSNVAYERVAHPGEVLRLGQAIEAKVLAVREHGKKIALGLKQLHDSPWSRAGETLEPGAIVEGTVKRVLAFGAFVAVLPGIEGLLHVSEIEPRGAPAASLLTAGERLSLRVLAIEPASERLSLSMRHADGRAIARDEAEGARVFEALRLEGAANPPRASLGDALSDALHPERRAERA